jgi:tetratricopeptide (TPR) repeat protein
MNTEHSIIKKRQHYYWLGMKWENENDLPKAIEAYKTYSTHLAEQDKHIPHQWISKFYEQLGDTEKSLLHLEKFAEGCTPPKAAEVYKSLGERYLTIHSIEKAVWNFENAIENNPNIGVKKKLDELISTLE